MSDVTRQLQALVPLIKDPVAREAIELIQEMLARQEALLQRQAADVRKILARKDVA